MHKKSVLINRLQLNEIIAISNNTKLIIVKILCQLNEDFVRRSAKYIPHQRDPGNRRV